MTPLATLLSIAEDLALEVRMYGQCRGRLHQPLVDGKRPACECRHCQVLARYQAFIAIVQTPATKELP